MENKKTAAASRNMAVPRHYGAILGIALSDAAAGFAAGWFGRELWVEYSRRRGGKGKGRGGKGKGRV